MKLRGFLTGILTVVLLVISVYALGNNSMEFNYSLIDEELGLVSDYINAKNLTVNEKVLKPDFVREDQSLIRGSGDNLNDDIDIKYPFVTYNIINDPFENVRKHRIEVKKGPNDGANDSDSGDIDKPNAKTIRKMTVRPIISINAITDNEYGLDECEAILRQIRKYYLVNDAKYAVAMFTGSVITNRTTYLDGVYEYKMGFDFSYKFTDTIESLVESIAKLTITSTIDNQGTDVEGPPVNINLIPKA